MTSAAVDLTEIARRAHTLLGQIAFGPAELIRAALEPHPEDYEAVFAGDAAKQAAEAYAAFWTRPPPYLTRVVHPEIRIWVAPAEGIAASRQFPGGYRKIAHLLVPGQVWCRFKLAGMNDVIAYDGLVARGERWAWFPKPWRVFERSTQLADAGTTEHN